LPVVASAGANPHVNDVPDIADLTAPRLAASPGCAGDGKGDQMMDVMTKLDVTYVGKGKDGEDVYRVGKTVLDALAKAELKEWGRK
jgi:hypothetical protein